MVLVAFLTIHLSSAAATNSRIGTVRARVGTSCALSTGASLAFGTLSTSGSNVNAATATGQLISNCSSGATYKIYSDVGSNPVNIYLPPRMRLGSSSFYLTYNIYSDSSRTTAFPRGSGAAVSVTGTSAQQVISIYGQVPSQTAPLGGNYTDTLTFSIEF